MAIKAFTLLTCPCLALLLACSAPPSIGEDSTSTIKGDGKAVSVTHANDVGDCTALNTLVIKQDNNESIAYLDDTPFTGEACSYLGNNKVHTFTTYKDGKREGLWQIFHENGRLYKTGYVRNGMDDGAFREYFKSGILRYEYHYDLGKKTGAWKGWYNNGTPYTERNFHNDQLHGKVLVWDENGVLTKEYDYVMGKLINSVMHFEEK